MNCLLTYTTPNRHQRKLSSRNLTKFKHHIELDDNEYEQDEKLSGGSYRRKKFRYSLHHDLTIHIFCIQRDIERKKKHVSHHFRLLWKSTNYCLFKILLLLLKKKKKSVPTGISVHKR